MDSDVWRTMHYVWLQNEEAKNRGWKKASQNIVGYLYPVIDVILGRQLQYFVSVIFGYLPAKGEDKSTPFNSTGHNRIYII